MSDIKQYILSLSPKERVSLIAFIATSLEQTDENLAFNLPNHIIEDSREIFKQWDADKIQGVSWKELRKDLKNTYLNVSD